MSSTASKPPIVLIHGMWMTPLSWEHWASHYTDRGHRVLAPAWPGLDKEPAELRRDPSPLRGIGHHRVVDHYDKIIRGLDQAADHHRPFVRRSLHPAPARPRAGRRRCGARYRRTQGCAQAAVLDAQVRVAGARESCEPEEGNAADHGSSSIGASRTRSAGTSPTRSTTATTSRGARGRSSRPASPTSTRTPRRRSTTRTPHERRFCSSRAADRSDLSAGGEPVELQAAAEGALCDRPQGVPGPLSLAGPGRLGGGRGLRAQLDDRARTRRRCRACRGRTRRDLTLVIDGGLHHHPDPDGRLRDVEADVRPGSPAGACEGNAPADLP